MIPSLSNTSTKILNIIGTESAYGMAGQQETELGEIVPQSPPPVPSPPASPFTTPLNSTPSTSTNPGPSVPTPTTPSTVTQQFSARGQRARTSLRNDFLVSDAETRSVLQDISNSLTEKNKISERKMRRRHLKRLHSSRMAKHMNMGPF